MLAALALSCAAGDEPTGGGGSGGRTLTGASGPGGAGGDVAVGAGGAGGATGGAATGGAGGQGGGLSGNLELCVLNEGGPADPCQMPEELDFGVVSSGTIEKRFFRVDNQTPSDVLFKSASVTSGQFTVQAVRFEQDPGDPNNFLRVDVDLPVTRASTQSLWFEVAYTASGANGPLPTLDVVVKMNVDNNPVADLHVPIVGSESGCPTGLGACDADPANGCETDTNTNNTHCGQCNNPCDPMGGTGQCVGGVCTLSGCDPYQADCDMDASTGCEVSLLNDGQHCGSCANDCSKSNTVTACSAGNCAIVSCQNNYGDCNVNPADGCETNLGNTLAHCGGCNLACDLANAAESCVPSMQTGLGVCTLGACNAGFKNCDLDPMTGCEVNTTNDVNNCGNCFSPCAFDHAAESCVNSACQMGMCDQNYANCNGFSADGCEVNTQNDKDHCGGCATDCDLVFPGSSVTCSGGACNFGGCLPNYYNIDNNTANGCEYACTFQSATDLPDNSFVDANCDGVDGNAADAIFVAQSGSDGNAGTRDAPKLTINGGIAQAILDGKHQVLVSEGNYGGRVTLSNGISLYGGYSASNNWARSSLYVSTINSTLISGGRMSALEGNNINTATTVDRFTITTGNTASAGVSNYGVYCNACTALTLKNSNVSAGTAGPGSPGGNGSNGAAGSVGGGGGAGSCDGSTPGSGGTGGASSCGRTGGTGGIGGNDNGSMGATGGTGLIGTLGGPGGSAGDPGGDGSNGNNGSAGSAGANGAAGSGGSVVGGFWQGGNGGTGNTGAHGNGGGGGGGGGGQDCFFCINGPGDGGGGGGGGGCGATGASGGTGAGGSFGIFLVNSTGIVLTNNTVASSNGGTGGTGGAGGTGGSGGGGGAGNTTCSGEIGTGGNGGVGGKGGDGGHGGGGAGGPSYAVYRSGTTVSTAGNTLSNGSGGAGGPSSGNMGATGASGLVF